MNLISNLCSPATGNPVANQFHVRLSDADVFQSYRTNIAEVRGNNLTLSDEWDCSHTTMKYLWVFLGMFGFDDFCGAAKMRRAIKKGEVKVVPKL